MAYVTHDQVEALTMGSRLAVMVDGRLQQVGAPDDVYATPANTFVARFLGSPGMNLLAGRVGTSGTNVEVSGAALALATRFDVTGDVIVGARPEHLAVSDKGLSVDVRAVESHGHERIVRASTADGEDVRFRVAADDPPPPPGQAIRLAAGPARAASVRPHDGDPAVGVPSANRRHQRRRDAGWAALFLAPSLAVLFVFVIYPLVRTFYMSTRRIGLFGRGSDRSVCSS